MKKAIITAMAALSLAAVALPAYADEVSVGARASASATPAQLRMDLKAEAEARQASSTERKDAMKTEAEARKASSTAARIELQQSVVKRISDFTGRVLNATIDRLEKIADRIDSRIGKVQASGGSTADSQSFMAQARAQLTVARQDVEAFASIDLSADKFKDNFQKVKDAASKVKDDLKAARTDLMESVRSLVSSEGGAHATSTASVSASSSLEH